MSTSDLIRHSLMCLGFCLGSDSKESYLIRVDIWKQPSCKSLCHPVHVVSIYFCLIYNNGPELRLKAVGRCICNCKAEEHMRKKEMGEEKLHLIVECVLKTLISEKNHTWSLRIWKLILFKAIMCKVCIRNLLYTLWISFFKDPLFSCCQLQEL